MTVEDQVEGRLDPGKKIPAEAGGEEPVWAL